MFDINIGSNKKISAQLLSYPLSSHWATSPIVLSGLE